MAPSCTLDPQGLRLQYERYRRAGKRARLVERSDRRIVVDLGDGVDVATVEELLVVERECCPFFELDWDAESKRLSISVAHAHEEPALGAIEYALALSR
jgi:hypothetical protein